MVSLCMLPVVARMLYCSHYIYISMPMGGDMGGCWGWLHAAPGLGLSTPVQDLPVPQASKPSGAALDVACVTAASKPLGVFLWMASGASGLLAAPERSWFGSHAHM
jgi:hypothetical protein